MDSSVGIRMKKLAALAIFIVIAGLVSYIAVYKASFLPNGYDIVSQQKDRVTVKSFNLIGMEKDTKTVVFSADDVWKIELLGNEIVRQKVFLWLLFTASSISILAFFIKLRGGKKWWRAIWESNLIVAIPLPIFYINNSLTIIQGVIANL